MSHVKPRLCAHGQVQRHTTVNMSWRRTKVLLDSIVMDVRLWGLRGNWSPGIRTWRQRSDIDLSTDVPLACQENFAPSNLSLLPRSCLPGFRAYVPLSGCGSEAEKLCKRSRSSISRRGSRSGGRNRSSGQPISQIRNRSQAGDVIWHIWEILPVSQLCGRLFKHAQNTLLLASSFPKDSHDSHYPLPTRCFQCCSNSPRSSSQLAFRLSSPLARSLSSLLRKSFPPPMAPPHYNLTPETMSRPDPSAGCW